MVWKGIDTLVNAGAVAGFRAGAVAMVWTLAGAGLGLGIALKNTKIGPATSL